MSATLANTLNTGHAGTTVRSVVGLALSVTITAGLFWVMPYLIKVAEHQLDHGATLGQVDFVRVPRDEEITKKNELPEDIPRPDPPPPNPVEPTQDDPAVETAYIPLPDPGIDNHVEIENGFSPGLGEGDYLPIVKVAPVYPQRALSRGVEGFCVVEYTVTRNGTIRYPVIVEDQCTSSLFHKASLDAVRKFKYKPRVIDGEAIEVPGVQNRFTYEISE